MFDLSRGRHSAWRSQCFVVLASSLIAVAGWLRPAHAAGSEAAPADARSSSTYDWTGFYVGGHFGFGHGSLNNNLSSATPEMASNSFGSAYGGLQVGYNYEFPLGWMLGAEANVSFPNFLEDGVVSTPSLGTVTDEIDYLGMLRARLGYALGPYLLYGAAGFTWSQARFTDDLGNVILRNRTGWTAAVGIEFVLAPAWTIRLEYLHDHLDAVTSMFPTGTRYESQPAVNMLLVGLDYQLDRPAGAVSGPNSSQWPLPSDDWNIHGQFTLIGQGYPPFHSPYQGPQSLIGNSQFTNTISSTLFIGVRPWEGTEVYVNPELLQGFGLSDTYGVAAFPNGEAQKSNFPVPRVNIARAFVRQTFGLDGEQETVEDAPNQLPGKQDVSRITVTIGKFVVTDYFDTNDYANDPRADFMNWNIYGGGSYDLTMDKLSYTWGGFAELNQPRWAIRAGYFLVPTVSNSNDFDMHIPTRGEYVAELELRYTTLEQPGTLRLFGWVNRANAGSYAAAVALPPTSPGYPNIALTREVRSDFGSVINVQQSITDAVGMFSRITWNTGNTEIIGWTDCNASGSLGVQAKGSSWGRPDDVIGLGGVAEALSPQAQRYFAAGGLGILIGDGRLNYHLEKALEAYYAYSVTKAMTLTADYQLIVDPAYNSDRGPVSIFSIRLHAEF